jgi:solute carrier family 38 (sodium-coupled neutral amino acid transporter), member 11
MLQLTSMSRAEFDLDSDELDDPSISSLAADERSPRLAREQRMPLLVGLADTAAVRRSLDGSLTLAQLNGHASGDGQDVDLEELAAKRTAGGSLLDSIANMANSILGAGTSSHVL